MSSPAAEEDFYFLSHFDGEPDTNFPTLQYAMTYAESLDDPTGTIELIGGDDGPVTLLWYENGQVNGVGGTNQ